MSKSDEPPIVFDGEQIAAAIVKGPLFVAKKRQIVIRVNSLTFGDPTVAAEVERQAERI